MPPQPDSSERGTGPTVSHSGSHIEATLPHGQIDPVPAAPSNLRLEAGAMIGEFCLVRRLGEGGMGTVWEAEQSSLRRRVALKLIRPEHVDARSVQFFQREARAGGKLHHA